MNTGDTVRADPRQLTLNQIWLFQLNSRQLNLDQNCRRQLERVTEMIQCATACEGLTFGINTGFGKLAITQLSLDYRSVLRK